MICLAKNSKRPLGVVLYRGASEIDGAPIVVIATFESSNEKTGNVVQTWILTERDNPIAAINNGHDSSICGDCPLRGDIVPLSNRHKVKTKNISRGCYVAIDKAPLGVWRAYHRGRYPIFDVRLHARFFNGRKLRLGAYGDPTAAPLSVWLPVIESSAGHLGYSHMWRMPKFQKWARYLMASVHSEKQAQRASAMGWRYFRTRSAEEPIGALEFICPASAERDIMTCDDCGACNGNKLYDLSAPSAPRKPSAVIIGHGSKSKMGAVNRNQIAQAKIS